MRGRVTRVSTGFGNSEVTGALEGQAHGGRGVRGCVVPYQALNLFFTDFSSFNPTTGLG